MMRKSVTKVDRKETARRQLVKLVFVIYWLLVFGGALRKWGLPEFQAELFFIRAPFTIALYGLALRRGFWPKTNGLLLLVYFLAIAAIALALLQLLAGGYGFRYTIIAAYGWLNYFFYVPLAFILPNVLRRNDLHRLLRHTLWFGIINTPLVFQQFATSPDSIFNRGSAAFASGQFSNLGAALGHIRPAGTFTSSLGLALFLGTLTVAVIYGWVQAGSRAISRGPLRIAATSALLIMLGLSGSRTAFATVALVLLSTVIAGILTRRPRLVVRAGVFPVAAGIFMLVLWPLVLPQGYKTFAHRWNSAQTVESNQFDFGILGRAVYPLYEWTAYLNGPVDGYLLGLGGNAAGRLNWVHLPSAAHRWTGYGIWGRESGWGVHLIELGIPLGLLYIIFRVWLTFWALQHILKATRKNNDILPSIAYGLVVYFLFIGELTVQGSVNGYVWLFLGIALAAARRRKDQSMKQRPKHAVAPPDFPSI